MCCFMAGAKFNMNGVAAHRVAELRVSVAQVTVVRQGLILRLICHCMRNAMRQTARLREQQGKNQQ